MNNDNKQAGKSVAITRQERLLQLEEEVRRLARTNEVLLDRVEQRINEEGGAFAAFQAASKLEKTVAERTGELQILNERLEHELDMRRNFEGALLRAKQEAEDATASRTQFLAAASHDLRQPLNAAVLYLQAINSNKLSAGDNESVRGIALALNTLDSLLSALLDISRLDSGGLHPEPSHFRLQPLLQSLAREYGSIAEARNLQLQTPPCPPAAVMTGSELRSATLAWAFPRSTWKRSSVNSGAPPVVRPRVTRAVWAWDSPSYTAFAASSIPKSRCNPYWVKEATFPWRWRWAMRIN